MKKISVAAFDGENIESNHLQCRRSALVPGGQLGKLLEAARKSGSRHAMMAGQLAPANLFNLRPDLRALIVLAKLRRRNAETLFGEVANQLAKAGLEVLNAMTFLDDSRRPPGPYRGTSASNRGMSKTSSSASASPRKSAGSILGSPWSSNRAPSSPSKPSKEPTIASARRKLGSKDAIWSR